MVPNTPVDTGIELFGRRIQLPLLTGPIGSLRAQFHPEDDIRDYNRKCIEACREEGVYQCFGDGLFDGVTEDASEASKNSGGIGIPILNPFSQKEILKKIELCKTGDPVAMGIVIDSAGLPHLKSRPDAVMICRPVLVSYYGGGTEGIRVYIQKLKDEFSDAMYMCGARKVSDIDGNMIRLTK